MLHAFSRSEELLGREGLQKLANSRIAVLVSAEWALMWWKLWQEPG